MSKQEIILAEPVRTAIGTFNGSLKGIAATELGAVVIAEVVRRAKIAPESIHSATMGNVVQAGNRMNPARQAAVGGGLPVSTPALTVNRVCGSGAQAIVSAAQEIASGNVQLAVAGGMENMDRAPYLLDGGRWGYRMGPAEIHDSMLRDGLNDAFSGEHSGWHTEDLVTKAQLTRESQDRWAERSQKRFAASQAQGAFDAEIVPVKIKGKKGEESFAKDEANRPDTTYEALAKLRPAFRKDGTITAGNAPGLNAGASAMIVSDRSHAEKLGMSPWARLVSYGIAAVEPGLFGLGPVPAVRIALDRAGWKIGDIDRIEINEAFAAVPLAVC
jgi:acetyl-CoA C-acetyltransferase